MFHRQAAVLAYQNLENLLNDADSYQIVGSQNMWRHKTRPSVFCLCVDDSGIKVFSEGDANHLKDAISFLGLSLEWHFKKGYVDISMPGYVEKPLQVLQHTVNGYPKFSPHEYIVVNFSTQPQHRYAMQEDNSQLLFPKETNYVQRVIGTLLYYATALDSTLLTAHPYCHPAIKSKTNYHEEVPAVTRLY